MVTILLIVIVILLLVTIFLVYTQRYSDGNSSMKNQLSSIESNLLKIESAVRDEIKSNRMELIQMLSNFQNNIGETIQNATKNQYEQLKSFTETLNVLTRTMEDKFNSLILRTDENNKVNREEQSKTIREFTESVNLRLDKISNNVEDRLKAINEQAKLDAKALRELMEQELKKFEEAFDRNVRSFNDLQREKFAQMEIKQNELIQNTDKKLEQMRETVDEKLQKTLNERLGQSFETVTKQLLAVQDGLGEMKTLAQDVGGLKKVLSNVKTRGGIGEVQLSMLLEQILAPEQYTANVKTKQGSSDMVEFAIKLPGKDETNAYVYLPIDAKFPKDAYEQLIDAYETTDTQAIDAASKNIESVIKKMAKDIHDKYIDPPGTTDFGIMFLPFESIYAEVVRRSSLLEHLQRDYKIVVTGPTTLAAILNSLQMGFKTLAIQKRSSEVWNILKAVKTEFGEFQSVLTKAQQKIVSANEDIDKLVGVRTRQINRKLKDVEILTPENARKVLGEEDLGISEEL